MAQKPKSGMYKTKARNLTEAQLKRAKGLKAAQKREVSISDTTRAKTGPNKGYTLGKGGKRLTGTVIMSDGSTAVYKGGKRVTNVPKASMKAKNPTRTTTTTTTTPTKNKPSASSKAGKAAAKYSGKGRSAMETARSKQGAAASSRGRTAAGARYAGMAKAGSSIGATKPSNYAANREAFFNNPIGYILGDRPSQNKTNASKPKASASKPSIGDRRRNPNGPGIQSWDGKKWVKAY